jgi:NAD(P)-dependent dehydrogenase (short-subunit alcohol dehydrogenase family)
VNVLSPGQTDTSDSQRIDKETRQLFESLIPRGKMGRPEEIATVALFLASDDSSFVRIPTAFANIPGDRNSTVGPA